MSTYRVELKDQNRWAVFQSTSETMYSPTFDSELEAEIFAIAYGRLAWTDVAAFTEQGQMRMASLIHRFFEEKYPSEPYPASWIDEDGEESTGASADDVVAALESNKGCSRVMFLGEFAEWRIAQRNRAETAVALTNAQRYGRDGSRALGLDPDKQAEIGTETAVA